MTSRTILITGCSSGIGYTSALGMKERGWDVHATARNEADLKHLSEQGLHAHYLDYTDAASVDACLNAVLSASGGRLDALFNNGAYGLIGAVEDIKTEDLRQQFEANLFGWHHLTREILPIMREQGHGRIIQCSSVLGIVSGKHRGPYAATKHALEALSSSLRMEVKPWNIHVAMIRPGPIATRFLETALRILNETIDLEATAYREDYQRSLARLGKGENSSVFKLPPEAVFKPLIHACEVKRPKPVYSVTHLTTLADCVRRALPTRWAEVILAKG